MKDMHSLALRTENGRIYVLDQQLLPQVEQWIEATDIESMVSIIRSLKVRGAPLIGVAAAVALARLAERGASDQELSHAALALRNARPTAINLMLAIDRLVPRGATPDAGRIVREAERIFAEDVELCEAMSSHGASLVQDGDNIVTHCNTGGLATAGLGTALGVITKAFEQGKRIHVYVDETRPLLQGGRLTAWECTRRGIPHTLICDNMAAGLMAKGKINRAFVGADRIALNGDFANKVGTYSLAVACHHHHIPFHPVAPYTTIDFMCPNGDAIPIEERHADEVRGVEGKFGKVLWSPPSPVYNPSFDVTPVALVTALVLDQGVFPRAELERGALTSLKEKLETP